MGDNYFELNIPPFLGLHPVFNVALLRPYFAPLFDTLEIGECSIDTHIISTLTACNKHLVIIFLTHRSRALNIKGSNFIELSKKGNSYTKASGSPGARFNKYFLI
jgi:hypothetical protein